MTNPATNGNDFFGNLGLLDIPVFSPQPPPEKTVSNDTPLPSESKKMPAPTSAVAPEKASSALFVGASSAPTEHVPGPGKIGRKGFTPEFLQTGDGIRTHKRLSRERIDCIQARLLQEPGGKEKKRLMKALKKATQILAEKQGPKNPWINGRRKGYEEARAIKNYSYNSDPLLNLHR